MYYLVRSLSNYSTRSGLLSILSLNTLNVIQTIYLQKIFKLILHVVSTEVLEPPAAKASADSLSVSATFHVTGKKPL